MADLHEHWMGAALSLAARGGAWVSPNPAVGAVVVKDGSAVGQGWHQRYGGPHAEVFALREAGELARGATLYCTLEPCNHTGKTPPCVHAVIAAGIKTVVLGARDPNPVASGGIAALRAAGIRVVEGICETECRRINAAFFKFVTTRVPFVALKWAMSLDGKIAAHTGHSKWITSELARAHAHRLRARHDAVLAGIGTVLADDPALNARLDTVEETASIRQPRRVVLDTHARTPLESRLFGLALAGPLIVIVGTPSSDEVRVRIDALRGKGAEVVETPSDANGRVPVAAALQELGKRGVLSVLVEGGSRVLGACVDARLADRAHVFIAPKIIGGWRSPTAVAGTGVERVTDALTFADGSTTTSQLGPDLLIEGALSDWGWTYRA